MLNWLLLYDDVDPLVRTNIYHMSVLGMYADDFVDERVTVGRHTYGARRGAFNIWLPDDRVTIGSFCSLAEGVRFVFGEHALDTVSSYPLRTKLAHEGLRNVDAFNKGPIIVGNDVWIGTNAIILSGITIGHGAVIGAGAVVTRDVPPYAVALGLPAKVRRYRFRPDQIELLLRIAWWDWPDDRVRRELDSFYDGVDAFIARHAPRG